MTRRIGVLLVVIGAAALLLGTIAGVVNRNVLDGPRFASHLDAMRRDPAVAHHIGVAATDRILRADPDLVAIRPLLDEVNTGLVSSDAFGPVFRRAVEGLHTSLTRSGSDQFVLRLADVGAVTIGALQALVPDQASRIPPGTDVTLADIGSQSFAGRTLETAHLVRQASWILPVIALLLFGSVVVWWRDRRAALRLIGHAVVGVGALIGVAAFATSVVVDHRDDSTLRGALVRAGWHEFDGPVWWSAGILVLAGLLVVGASTWERDVGPRTLWADGRQRLLARDLTVRGRLVHGAALVVTGVCLLLRPHLVLAILASAAAVVILLLGLAELVAALRERVRQGGLRESTAAAAGRLVRPVVWIAAGALVVGLLALNGQSPDESVPAVTPVVDSGACNGHIELCDRRYNDVTFPATHNSMAAADEPGWFLAEQPDGVIGQLDAGIRVLLIDSWYGQATQRSDVIATAAADQARGEAELRTTYGDAVVDSALRLRNAVGLTPRGEPKPYLCHGLCELGSTEWLPLMIQVRQWLDAHPREVVTFFVQDEVSPADTAKLLDEAGLTPMLHTQKEGEPWPTLGQMIDSGHRVVVLMENHGGGARYPQLLQGFDWVQDTPYDARTVSDFSCRRLRGKPSSPIFLINHWLNRADKRVSDSATVNAWNVLWPRVHECEKERGLLPNFVAVNFYDLGDLMKVVDKLNGF